MIVVYNQCGPLSLVESFIVLLRQCLLCHKEPARRIQSPLLGAFCLLLAGSLWHKNSWLQYTESSYYRHPFAIKKQRGTSKKPLVGGFVGDELFLYGIRLLAEQLPGIVLKMEMDHTVYYTYDK